MFKLKSSYLMISCLFTIISVVSKTLLAQPDAQVKISDNHAINQDSLFLDSLQYYLKIIQSESGDLKTAQAYYKFGEFADKAAFKLSVDALHEAHPRASGMYYDDDFISWPGLLPYTKIGIDIRWSHLGQMYYYGGEVYEDILKKYPKSKWAGHAAFKLLLLEKYDTEWEGDPKGPITEIKRLDSLIAHYPNSGVLPSMYLQKARDLIYLKQIFSGRYKDLGLNDPDRYELYASETRKVLLEIITKYPNSNEAKIANQLIEKQK